MHREAQQRRTVAAKSEVSSEGNRKHSRSALQAFGSVQQRLILLVVTITLVGLIAAVSICVLAYQNEKESVNRQLAGTARAIASAVDLHLREAETLLRTIAASSELRANNLPGFQRLCENMVTNSDMWVVMEDASGQQLINSRVPFGTLLPRGSTLPQERAAYSRGETYVSDLFVGPLLNQPVVFVGIPVPHSSNEYHLSIAMKPHAVSSSLSVNLLAPQATITVADRKGIIIARNKGGQEVIGSFATPDMVRAVLSNQEGIRDSVTKEGVAVLAAIGHSQMSDWSVLVGIPKSELLASAHRLLMLAMVLAALLVAFTIWISLWIGRSIVQAVSTLVNSTYTISQGEVPSQITTGLEETDFVAAALQRNARQVVEREKRLEELSVELENKIEAQTSELSVANQRLIRANRELENFARIAVHDLREPLRTIHRFAGLLREDFERELPDEARIYTDRIQSASTRMSRLLESIFAYSKAKASPTNAGIIHLNSVLDEVLSDLEFRLRETEGRVIAGDLGCAFADAGDVHQMMLNLIGNSLKFQRECVPPVIEIESGRVGQDIHLVVKDNGIGFDSQFAEKIFHPFEQLQTEKRKEGTGMGLAIVRRLAERQRGTVYATSVPGVGSQFVIIFPAVMPGHSPTIDTLPSL